MNWKPEIETKVRSLMSAWANSIPDNPFPKFGDKVSFVSLEERPTFVVQLNTLYEARFKPIERTRPFTEAPEPVDASLVEAFSEGKTEPEPVFIAPDSVDIWSFDSPLRSEFEAQEAEVEVPNSYHPTNCPACDGKGGVPCLSCNGAKLIRCTECRAGKKPCEKCSGRGKNPCMGCKGKGFVPGVARDDQQAAPDILCVDCNGSGGSPCDGCGGAGSTPCPKCQEQGTLPCIKCRGEGTQPCHPCSGKGKIIKGLAIKIQYSDASDRVTVHDKSLPEGLLPDGFQWSKVSEKVVEAQEIIVQPPNLSAQPQYLQAAVTGILKKAEAGVSAQAAPARIILQRLQVEKVPVFAVVYRFQDKMYDVWITGVENKNIAKESPFKEYARDQAMKAMKFASQGQQDKAQEILSKVATVAKVATVGEDVNLQQVRRASLAASAREFLLLHQLMSAGMSMGLMAFIAHSCPPTHHLFWPVFDYGAAAFGTALLIGNLVSLFKIGGMMSSGFRRIFSSLAIVACVALGAEIHFSMVQLPLKQDVAEYKSLIADHFPGALQPETMNAADIDFLKFLVQTFEPMGVDVSDAKNALDQAAKAEEEARRQAELREEAQAAAKAKTATRAALVREEIEEAKRKRQQEAARKAKLKKKKKKGSRS